MLDVEVLVKLGQRWKDLFPIDLPKVRSKSAATTTWIPSPAAAAATAVPSAVPTAILSPALVQP